MLRTVLTLLLVGLLAGSAWAGSFSLNFNDYSAQFGYTQALKADAYGESSAHARLLYNDEEETLLGSVGAGVKGSPGNIPGLGVGVDVVVNGAETDNDKEVLGVGIGLLASYAPPVLEGVGTTARVTYAPEIFSFLDSEGYLESAVGISYAILPNASLTLEYQNIEVEYENLGKRRLDDTLRVGIRLDF